MSNRAWRVSWVLIASWAVAGCGSEDSRGSGTPSAGGGGGGDRGGDEAGDGRGVGGAGFDGEGGGAEGGGEMALDDEGEAPGGGAGQGGSEGEGEGGGEGGDEGGGGEIRDPPRGCIDDSDCNAGQICLVGLCKRVGDEPPARDVCRGLPEERPSADPPPAPGADYIFLALPGTPALARIEISTLEVSEVPLSAEAVAVTTLPGRDVAVVLLRDGGAAVVGSEGGGEAIVTEIDVRQGLTHLLASEFTAHIVAWADHDHRGGGVKNPSEISVIDLSEVADLARFDPAVYHLSVGARPRSVTFDRAGRSLFVVTDDGVSLTALEGLRGDQILPPIPVHEDPVGSDPEARTVLLTPDGAYAVVMQPGESVLRLVDLSLDDSDPMTLELDGPPTDVAFIPDDDPELDARRVIAVVGDSGQAVLLDVPGDWLEGGLADVIEIETPVCQVSVSPTGDEAALFSSVGQVPALVRLDLREGVGAEARLQVERLASTILGVIWADDGASAVAFHSGGDDLPLFSMMTFTDGFFAKSFTPDGGRGRYLFTPSGGDSEPRFLITVTNPAENRHELLSLPTSSFIPTAIPLRAAPSDLGLILQSNQAYVTQDAPEGLISFITLAGDHETKEVSRFRRNRRID